jgi:4-hydroxyproline epimerase
VLNVPSFRTAKEVQIDVPGIGKVSGDVAWGGNWFFLITQHEEVLTLENVPRLLEFTSRVRRAVNAHGFTSVDHVELFGPPTSTDAHSRNFVLCPGNAYDRSPCGTGTSAKLACLFSDGKIREGDVWRQESITGSIFEGSVATVDGQIIPMIKGRAFVTAETTLILDDADPLCWGVSAAGAQSFSSRGGPI